MRLCSRMARTVRPFLFAATIATTTAAAEADAGAQAPATTEPAATPQRVQPDAIPAAPAPSLPAVNAPTTAPAPGSHAATGVAPAPVFLNHPSVIDTAHLKSGDTTVALFGITGWAGDAARGLQAFITQNGDRVSCRPHAGGELYTCMMPTGLDVAATALANGAAEAAGEAPADYHQQEAAAQSAHLGIWAGLPPAPVAVQNPVVQTTAEIVGDGQVFLLDGLVGFPAQYYTLQLQNYIAAHGNRLTCRQQPANGNYVCLLPDGTDIAAVALSNGLARVSQTASAQYRADQAKAVAAKSGFWFNPQVDGGITPIPLLTATPNCCVYQPGDLDAGITYADGVPTAVIDGEPVFFDYIGLLGFGFFDLQRHWHPAPQPYLNHLNRFHPEGAGLQHLADPVAARAFAAFRPPAFPGSRAIPGPGFSSSGGFPSSGGLPSSGALPRVFNGPNTFIATAPFRAPGAFPATPGVPPPTLEGALGAGRLRPGFRPLNPALTGGRVGIAPFRPLYATGPRPGFAGAGGFHPGIIAAPHFAPAFIGRR